MIHVKHFVIKFVACCALAAVRASPTAASEPPMHAGQLAHLLDRATTTARVLYIAAHPDDENTRLLAYLANARHLNVAYLSLTRGGGGQNLIGAEQGELLGLVRTEELLAARRLDGARQLFTRLPDFGYSKSADETFSLWGHEEALSEVVRAIRAFQPDVIISRFDERPPNHGHHTASAILAREAFAAADPARFPELGLSIWRAERLLHNFPTWRGQIPPPDALRLEIGGYDPRLGYAYGELAALSRSQHKSQGFGIAGERGELLEHFVWVTGSRPERDLLDGVALGWERYGAGATELLTVLAEAKQRLGRDAPEEALPALAKACAALERLAGGAPDVRQREGLAMLEEVMVQASGLYLRATAKRPSVTPGGALEVQIERVERGGKRQYTQRALTIPADAPVSLPLAEPLRVAEQVTLAGRTFEKELPILYVWTDRVHGERVRQVLVLPPGTVTPLREAVLPVNGKSAPVLLRVRAQVDGLLGRVSLRAPEGWRSVPADQPVSFEKAGDEQVVRFELSAPKGKAAAAIVLQPELTVDGRSWSFEETTIDYPHIPVMTVLRPASLKAVPLALKEARRRVGYIMGSGDSVAEDLLHVGLPVELLDDAALEGGDLSRFTTIVVGVRAYNQRPSMRAVHARLMRFVERGGTLVVQYNTTSSWSPLAGPLGPYPLELGAGRVTDEAAAVRFVEASHPMLRAPNLLGPSDFEGWVQERGIYFASKWDEHYHPLFSMADPGEAPQEGSTLVASHGKGRYVYTGLAFFRQLRAGVPGAYRLFVNLLGGQ